MVDNFDHFFHQVEHLFRVFCQSQGLRDGDFISETLRYTPDDEFPRVIVSFFSQVGTGYVVKYALSENSAERLSEEVEALLQAREKLGCSGRCRVPKIHHYDAAAGFVVLEFINGQTAFDQLLLMKPACWPNTLLRCGGWLGKFHQATFRRRNRANPSAMIGYHSNLLDNIERGLKDVADVTRFRAFAQVALSFAQRAQGAPVTIASAHGDAHLKNFIVADDFIIGIDLSGVKNRPVEHDLAQLIVNYCSYFYPDNAHGGLSKKWYDEGVNAILRNYPYCASDDVGLLYLVKLKVLQEWAKIPQRPSERSFQQDRRLEGLRQLALILT